MIGVWLGLQGLPMQILLNAPLADVESWMAGEGTTPKVAHTDRHQTHRVRSLPRVVRLTNDA